MTSSFPRIGFIGAGNICNALVTGFINSGEVKPNNVFISAPSNRNLATFSQLGCQVTNNNSDLLPGSAFDCSIIFLCVKPAVIRRFSSSHPFLIHNGRQPLIIVSVIAGTTIARLHQVIAVEESGSGDVSMEERPKASIYIYRMMPNTACSIGQGICGLCHCRNGCQYDEEIKSLLSKIGFCDFVSENELNVITGLGGSGIAFVYMFIQSFAEAAVKMGLPRNLALQFTVQTFLGASQMVRKTGKHPMQLRDDVCSPGGTTIHGVHALQKANVSSAVVDAVEAATKRAEELSLD